MTDGLPAPRRQWAAVAIAIGACLSILDGSMLNVALPTLAHDFKVSAAQSILVVNAYQLALSVGLLPLAAVGDAVGYRRVCQSGLLLFLLATIACAMSPNLTVLTTARIVQGLGAAGIMSVNTALIRHSYPSNLLGRGIAFNSMTVAASSAAGPALAGLILSIVSWHWLFILTVPLAIASLVIGWKTLPKVAPTGVRFDALSAVLSVAMMGFFLSTVDGAAHGLSSLTLLAGAATAIAAGIWLLTRESLSPNPLFPLDLLRRPIIALSVSTSACTFIAQMLTIISLPFVLSRAGWSPGDIGLAILPWPLAIAVGAPLAGRLADRWPAGLLGGIGLLITAAGMAALACLPAHPSLIDVAWRMVLCGAGAIIFQAPNVRLIIGSAPRHRSGAAGGLIGAVRLTGQTVGSACAALLFQLGASRPTNPLLFAPFIVMLAALISFTRLAVDTPVAASLRRPS